MIIPITFKTVSILCPFFLVICKNYACFFVLDKQECHAQKVLRMAFTSYTILSANFQHLVLEFGLQTLHFLFSRLSLCTSILLNLHDFIKG